MSALIAEAGGLTFDLPQDNIAQSQGMRSVRGGASSGEGKNLDPVNELLKDELYYQEGLTDEYYKSIGALQRFAAERAAAGYDVTKPDLTNPESVRYFTMYQEALADLQNKRNMLKRGATLENKAIENENIRMIRNQGVTPTFANIGMNDVTQQIWNTIHKAQNQEELDRAIDMRDALIEMYTSDLANSQDPQEREELRAQVNSLRGMMGGVGMTEYQKADLAQRESQFARRLRAEAAKKEPSQKGLSRFATIQDALLSKDLSQLAAATGMNDAAIIDLPSGTYIQFTDQRGELKREKIDPNRPQTAFRLLNGMINQSWDGSQLDSDDVFDSIRKAGYDPFQVLSAVGAKMDLAPDISQDAVNSLVTQFQSSNDNMDVLEDISSVIRLADGAISPPKLTERAFKSGGNSIVLGIEPERNFTSKNSLRIKIANPTNTKESANVDLRWNNPKDAEILRELLQRNIDDIPRDVLEQRLGIYRRSGIGTVNASNPINDDRF